MGRTKKYHTEVELKDAKSKQWKLYYEKNKAKINALRMEKYYEKRNSSL
jgi:hypothetical protein